VDVDVPTKRESAEGGAPDMARTCACNCCTRRQVEPEVLTEELPLTARANAGVGTATERRGWAGGGLSVAEPGGEVPSVGVWGVPATGGY